MTEHVLDTKAIRINAGSISQAELAVIACVDQSSVALWEGGKSSPSRAAAALIEQFCRLKQIPIATKAAPKNARHHVGVIGSLRTPSAKNSSAVVNGPQSPPRATAAKRAQPACRKPARAAGARA